MATPPKPAAVAAVEAAPAASHPPQATFWAVIAHALAQRISSPRAIRQASTSALDFILVTGALGLIAGGLYGLFTIKDIPKETLPIIASLLSFISGSILGAYAGYRWGASDTMKKVAIAEKG